MSARRSDAGFSIIELLVYMMLSIIVLTIVGGILISAVRASVVVRASAEANNSAQVGMQSLARGVHNAIAIEVSSPAPSIVLVRTRSASSQLTGQPMCRAWAAVNVQGTRWELRTLESASAIAAPTTAAAVSGWTLLSDRLSPIAGEGPIFTRIAPSAADSVGGVQVRAATYGVRTLAEVGTANRALNYRTSIYSKQTAQTTGASPACF